MTEGRGRITPAKMLQDVEYTPYRHTVYLASYHSGERPEQVKKFFEKFLKILYLPVVKAINMCYNVSVR